MVIIAGILRTQVCPFFQELNEKMRKKTLLNKKIQNGGLIKNIRNINFLQ
jgi:hypothetical protein